MEKCVKKSEGPFKIGELEKVDGNSKAYEAESMRNVPQGKCIARWTNKRYSARKKMEASYVFPQNGDETVRAYQRNRELSY